MGVLTRTHTHTHTHTQTHIHRIKMVVIEYAHLCQVWYDAGKAHVTRKYFRVIGQQFTIAWIHVCWNENIIVFVKCSNWKTIYLQEYIQN
jgi:hypothetical protein